ncbi:MAG: hypothetical protein JSR09_04270 [Bacteroidetes bacterium]|nr:hypothetical protein [Bacteroidota bacterium]MBS1648902.1 hypothetical protein [Bacteroidota bacterium]
MNNKKFWAKKIIGITICAITIAALLSWVVMFLWNEVLVTVIGVKLISFWQAVGLLVLSKILFGGFSRGFGRHRRKWNFEMKEKWQHMSVEEKEKFKQEWRNKCSMWSNDNKTKQEEKQ